MILPPALTENVGDCSCAGPPIFAPYIAPKLSSSFQWQYVCIPSWDSITFCHLWQGKISGGNAHICKQSAYLINFQPMCAILAIPVRALQRWQIIDICWKTDNVIHCIDIFIIIWYFMPSYFVFPLLTFLNVIFSIYITFQCYENGEVPISLQHADESRTLTDLTKPCNVAEIMKWSIQERCPSYVLYVYTPSCLCAPVMCQTLTR